MPNHKYICLCPKRATFFGFKIKYSVRASNWHSLIHPHTGLCVSHVLLQVYVLYKVAQAPKPMDPLYRTLLEQLLKNIQERQITYGNDPVMMAILRVAEESIEAKLQHE